MVSKYEEFAANKKQLKKLINQILLLMKKNEILVHKVTIGRGGGRGERKELSL